jgi:hypothetical protein
MGLRGRNWMEKDFSWESVSSKMLALYRECIPVAQSEGRHSVRLESIL